MACGLRSFRGNFRSKERTLTKILIVDDDAVFALVLQQILECCGHETRTARDGSAGYANYLAFRPDLVITDIQMPGCDGIELMQQIRTHNPCMKAIYMSADLNRFRPKLEEERRRYGADLIAKPFSRSDLMRLLPEESLGS